MEKENRESLSPSLDISNQYVGSFGNRLKQERLKKKLTLDDVAGELFILRRHIEAIEAEDFKALPQMAFARGFVVNYAKFLGLDSDQIAESFNRSYPDELKKKRVEDIVSPLKPMGTLQREGRRSIKINPLLLLGAIALIILAIFIIRTVTNAQDATADEDTNIAIVDELSASEQSAGAAINTGSNGSALNNSGSALDLNANQNAELDFNVQYNTTINVVDATGKTLLVGDQVPGNYKLSGQPPFQIQIGKVSSVTLTLNGTPVQLNNYAQGNTADFSLVPQS